MPADRRFFSAARPDVPAPIMQYLLASWAIVTWKQFLTTIMTTGSNQGNLTEVGRFIDKGKLDKHQSMPNNRHVEGRDAIAVETGYYGGIYSYFASGRLRPVMLILEFYSAKPEQSLSLPD